MSTPISPVVVNAYYAFGLPPNINFLLDSTGHGSILTNTNVVSQVAGLIGAAASFNPASSQYLSAANNAYVSPVGSFSLSVWIKPVAVTALAQGVVTTYGSAGTGTGFILSITKVVGNTTCAFSIYPSAAQDVGGGSIDGGNVGNLTAGWNLLVCYYDAATKNMGMSLNGGAFYVLDGSNSPSGYSASSNLLLLGDEPSLRFYGGQLDETAIYNTVLTADSVDWLWNGGAGRTYTDYVASGPGAASAVPGMTALRGNVGKQGGYLVAPETRRRRGTEPTGPSIMEIVRKQRADEAERDELIELAVLLEGMGVL